MNNWVLVAVGVVCVLVGGIWSLQGAGVIGGSSMSSSPTWLVIGLVVALAGLAIIAAGARRLRRRV